MATRHPVYGRLAGVMTRRKREKAGGAKPPASVLPLQE